MSKGTGIETVRRKYEDLSGVLTERSRRYWAATEARALGYGGITQVSEATGLAENTIRAGLAELADPEHAAPTGRIRAGDGYQMRFGVVIKHGWMP